MMEPLPSVGGAPRLNAPRVLDLFSGIGGFALAFEAAGFQTIAFAEIEPYPCKVLAQHWPEVPNLGDVRAIDGRDFAGVDVVCGGFPCQDISTAGKGAGIHGERSGLWLEMLRIIRGSRPAFCLLENVPALRSRGADVVLGGLEEAGYACRPFVVGAVNAGANHRRQRVWIVAYANHAGRPAGIGAVREPQERDHFGRVCAHVSYSASEPLGNPRQSWQPGSMGNADFQGLEVGQSWEPGQQPPFVRADWWELEPALGRVAHGVPHRAHRIKALGNSIVPAVAYPFAVWIYNVLTARSAPPTSSAEGSQS